MQANLSAAARELVQSDALAHVVTINADGSSRHSKPTVGVGHADAAGACLRHRAVALRGPATPDPLPIFG